MNEPLSKKDYEERLQKFQGNYERIEEMKTLYLQTMSKMVRKYVNIENSEDCTGDYIEGSSQCYDCYDVTDSEDCRYVCVGVNVKDNYDCNNMYLKPELCYETLGTINVHTVAYCTYVFDSQRLLYCDYCFNCSDCFACSGLTRKQYCIFNKQYTKKQYEKLVPTIIDHMKETGEWGLFMPAKYSPFGYNESLANEYVPLSKKEALNLNFLWHEEELSTNHAQSFSIENHINDVDENITQQVLVCEETGKSFRIIPQELSFYKEQKIPVPRLCPDQRYNERMKLRNARQLWKRQCAECNQDVQSTFAPDRPETVCCEPCYLTKLY